MFIYAFPWGNIFEPKVENLVKISVFLASQFYIYELFTRLLAIFGEKSVCLPPHSCIEWIELSNLALLELDAIYGYWWRLILWTITESGCRSFERFQGKFEACFAARWMIELVTYHNNNNEAFLGTAGPLEGRVRHSIILLSILTAKFCENEGIPVGTAADSWCDPWDMTWLETMEEEEVMCTC